MKDTIRANQIDAAVGANVRRIRGLRGMSQEALAAQLGVTFQQVQKYEKGSNRISASKLVMVAEALGCDLITFFEGVNTESRGEIAPSLTMRALRLAALYDGLPNEAVREALFKLAVALTGDREHEAAE